MKADLQFKWGPDTPGNAFDAFCVIGVFLGFGGMLISAVLMGGGFACQSMPLAIASLKAAVICTVTWVVCFGGLMARAWWVKRHQGNP